MEAADEGHPIVISSGNNAVVQAYMSLAENVLDRLNAKAIVKWEENHNTGKSSMRLFGC